MTDRRATDHSFGHLGEATYDTIEKKWTFSRIPVLPSIIRPIQPLQPCIPPSAQSTLKTQRNDTDRASNRNRDQKRSLIREIPQIGAAATVLGPLVRAADVETSQARSASGDLVASGTAKVLSKHLGDRSLNVLAVAHGEAGHVLRLIKPRLEDHTWDGDDSVKLRLLNPSTSEDGYWLDGAGSIEQIVFSSGVEGDRSWLAVRKLASTTILQPLYQRTPGPTRVPPGFQDKYRPSLLDPNPAVTITSAMTNGRNHADVAFNPWYPRQFAVLDEEGHWSAWDVEGRKRAGSKVVTLGKSGYILDDRASSDTSLDIASNGWGRILWAGNVSTIVVCNDRHLAVFDLKSYPIRLRSPDLVPNGSFGRILEVKRSPLQHDKVFVLTNSRLFLLQIKTAGEWLDYTDGTAGARIIMSCLHYREAQGNLLKLELHEEGDVCTAFLVSSGMFLVNVYKFTTTPDAATPVTWSIDSFSLERGANEDTLSKLVGFCVLPATLERSGEPQTSHMGSYLDHGNFLQAFALGENLEMSKTLLAECRMVAAPLLGKPARYEQISPPSESQAAPPEAHFLSSRTIDDFVVPDGFEDYESGSERKAPVVRPSIEDDPAEEPAPKVIDAQRWYELATKGKAAEPPSREDYHDVEIEMADYIQNIVGGIQHRRQAGLEGLSTFHDLAGFEKFTEDVDDGAALLQDFINNFEDNYAESSMAITLHSAGLLRMLDIEPDESSGDSLPNLSNVYDRLVNLWVTSLPKNTPAMARIAKEKVVRNVAADLCLSSILVSIRDKSVPLPTTAPQDLEEGPILTLPIHGGRPPPSPRTPSRSRFSSQPLQDHGFEPSSSYATPAPSESALSGEPAEDPAVARLRGYALSIKSLKPLGPTCASILAQWPETPGSDPSTYVWRPDQISGAAEEEGDSDEEAARQKEEKRRKRTEKFLKRQKGVASPRLGTVLSSQPPLVVESQPAYRFAASQVTVASSSQADGGLPMTQPSAGAFGSRAGLGKKKKRKTGF
ncbi:hypothetical protein V500_11121 [Pseudogymnoascus sp. VKM F-4518 (FW-2643)]|nr:hypothetical protein V500_11121 [Pseudogymnoascus sp. VKM F-4518 (FW-2643)]